MRVELRPPPSLPPPLILYCLRFAPNRVLNLPPVTPWHARPPRRVPQVPDVARSSLLVLGIFSFVTFYPRFSRQVSLTTHVPSADLFFFALYAVAPLKPFLLLSKAHLHCGHPAANLLSRNCTSGLGDIPLLIPVSFFTVTQSRHPPYQSPCLLPRLESVCSL